MVRVPTLTQPQQCHRHKEGSHTALSAKYSYSL